MNCGHPITRIWQHFGAWRISLHRRVFSLWLLLALLPGFVGCAPLEKNESASREMVFPQRRLPVDAASLEIGLVQLDRSQADTFETFWSLLDQQKLPISIRQLLDQNGLRAAVMPSHAPTELHQLQQPRPVELQQLDAVQQQMAKENLLQPEPRLILHQRITSRSGETHPVEVSEFHPQATWNLLQGDLRSVGSGQQVRGVVQLIAIPQGDGSVRLRLVPEIHHGDMRPTINVAERAFVLDSGQTVQKLADLAVDLSLRPGETIVLAPTSDISDLGKLFFGEPDRKPDRGQAMPDDADSQLTHRFLMIRVVQTQIDDLFGNFSAQQNLNTTSRR